MGTITGIERIFIPKIGNMIYFNKILFYVIQKIVILEMG